MATEFIYVLHVIHIFKLKRDFHGMPDYPSGFPFLYQKMYHTKYIYTIKTAPTCVFIIVCV